MGYVDTEWSENQYTEQNIIDQLNNMETQYDEFKSVVDAHVISGHPTLYYTSAEAASRYRTGTTKKGDYDTLDGLHATDILTQIIPIGGIMIWSGAYENIPEGYTHCDGYNSTPDLVGSFIRGAGNLYNSGSTGGSNSITPEGTLSIAEHALTIDEMPAHTHSFNDYYNTGYAGAVWGSSSGGQQTSGTVYTNYTGGGYGHSHTGSFTGDSYDNRPPYIKLLFLKKD